MDPHRDRALPAVIAACCENCVLVTTNE
jgi:hypothetical protein